MAKQISFNIKLNINGKEQLVAASTDVKEFRKNWDKAESSAVKFSRTLMDMANKFSMFEQGANALKDFTDKLSTYNRSASRMAQITGLQGEELRALRSEAQAVADTYGYEMEEVIAGVSSMMKGFGISADEAMRLVRDGLMSGADATGQFFDILGEYPTYFREAGVSAEQFTAIVTNGAKMGVFSDKAADTIKEGNLRLREMTTATAEALDAIGLSSEQIQSDLRNGLTTTFEVMQQVGAKLKELPQTSAEVGTAIADIFGGPGEDAGLAYIESLADMQLSMEGLKSEAGEAGAALDGQVDSLTKLNQAVGAVVDQFNKIPNLQPFLAITSQIGMTLVGIGSLTSSLKALGVVQLAVAAKSKLVSVALVACTGRMASSAAVTRVLSAAMKGAAYQMIAVKMALRGLMSATIVGVAFVALGAAIEAIMNAFDGASEESEKFQQHLEDTKQAADNIKQTYESSLASTFSSLMTKYKDLQSSWKALSTEHQKRKWIAENRDALKELGLTVNTVSAAEDAMVNNTEAVVAGFKKRAQAAAYAAKLQALYSRQIELTDKKTEMLKNTKWNGDDYKILEDTSKELKDINRQIESTSSAMAELNRETDKAKPAATTSPKTSKTTTSTTKEVHGAIWQYENEISTNDKKMREAGSEDAVAYYAGLKKQAEDAYKAFKLRVGIDTPTATEAKTYLEELRAQLQAKEKELENNLTVDARLSVLADIDNLQRQINETTGGKVTIGADVEPSYIVSGSDEDKRRSYSNAQSRINRIKSDYEIGIIPSREEAGMAIEAINKTLQDMRLKPLEIDLDAEGAKDDLAGMIEGLNNMDLSRFSSITDTFKSIGDITDTTAKGFATAGASCAALGNTLQQLGADGAAAKAGLIMGALGQLALSFASAMNSASKNWITWLAFGISGTAQLISMVATISQFATGGIVGGGSKTGDKVLARVNSGEMILNFGQQKRLWDIINGATPNVGVNNAASVYRNPVGNISNISSLAGAAETHIHVDVAGGWTGKDFTIGLKNAQKILRKSGVKV